MKTEIKKGIPLLVLAGIFIIAIPFIVISASSSGPEDAGGQVFERPSLDFDHRGDVLFKSREEMAPEYLKGNSTQRTLNDYYSLRQYLGSPPVISHRITDEKIENVNCLSCQEKGGWSQEFNLNTPLTPHPEQVSCIQCHVKPQEVLLFKDIEWISTRPPLLGRAYLPGAPVPVPHDLEGRGNCTACHLGPGSIDAIRSSHPERGNCRQCHVPDMQAASFEPGR